MQQMADGHYRIRLLKQCFLLWRIFITQEQNQRILDQMQNETKRKMAALLETAAAAAAAAANSTQVNAVSSELLQTVRDNTYASPGLTSVRKIEYSLISLIVILLLLLLLLLFLLLLMFLQFYAVVVIIRAG